MKTKRYVIKNLVLAIMVVVIYRIVNDFFFAGVYLIFPESMLENHYFLLDTLFCAAAGLLYILWLYRLHQRGEFAIDMSWGEACSGQNILIIVLGVGGISTLWFISVQMGLQDHIPIIAESMQSFDDTWSSIETESYIWVFLSVVVFGPIVEECMFRGVMYHYLEQVKAGWFPILATGICFGLWHGEPVQVVYTAIMGVIIGIIYATCRDLKVTIVIHVLNNFLSTLPPFLDTPQIQDMLYQLSLIAIIPTVVILRKMAIHLKETDSIYSRR